MGTNLEEITESHQRANELFEGLTRDVTIPESPDFSGDRFLVNRDTTSELYKPVRTIEIDSITENRLDGEGAFDQMMGVVGKHISREFDKNRITGTQYSEVYIQVIQGVLQSSVTFALQKDRAKWEAITAQMQARIAEVRATQAIIELEKTKADAIKSFFDMNLTAAEYGLTKLRMATEKVNRESVIEDVGIKQFQRNFALPSEQALTDYRREALLPSEVAINRTRAERNLPAEASVTEYRNRVLQPLERDIQTIRRDEELPTEIALRQFELERMNPIRLAQEQHLLNQRMPVETNVIKEQYETQRANTSDTKSDGISSFGGTIALQQSGLRLDNSTKQYNLNTTLPKQSDLIDEQITLTAEQGESERASTLDTRADGTTSISGSIGLQKRNLTADAAIKEYNLTSMLPKQLELTEEQITLTAEQAEAERAKTLDDRSDDTTTVAGIIGLQKRNLTADAGVKEFNLGTILPKQSTLLSEQIDLTEEQIEVERAKTLDTRTDGTTVKGSVGKQKDLYTQQIDSFVKDAQYKVVKLFTDSWITQKTLDDGLTAPTQFTNTNINSILTKIRSENDLNP